MHKEERVQERGEMQKKLGTKNQVVAGGTGIQIKMTNPEIWPLGTHRTPANVRQIRTGFGRKNFNGWGTNPDKIEEYFETSGSMCDLAPSMKTRARKDLRFKSFAARPGAIQTHFHSLCPDENRVPFQDQAAGVLQHTSVFGYCRTSGVRLSSPKRAVKAAA